MEQISVRGVNFDNAESRLAGAASATLPSPDYGRVARHSGVIRRSDAMYALEAKAAIFRRAWRLLPALAAILIPASVLSKKSAMLSRPASERISLCFFALVSARISV